MTTWGPPNRLVSEEEFRGRIREVLKTCIDDIGVVTGPGRSGAIASVYASHILRVPFIPFGTPHPNHLGPLLIIDTARESGATLRKAERKYAGSNKQVIAVYEEPPRVYFWYEPGKPQSYRRDDVGQVGDRSNTAGAGFPGSGDQALVRQVLGGSGCA